ncbi:acyl carrier protein [Amycolatopsis sp. H20-H5]|uniref:acyl carrier protein n=1 Tax=Amycolatopsis sp. H20-H5 TaxID=3046309 RepID=UPI002DB763BA|nr:phosphopantetheine-binding protein [Amycolatopsis sp. H20-H5]MEC3975506.1 phosphopantetheine-binding protein [Amycolatopsis sp. H20-H5]
MSIETTATDEAAVLARLGAMLRELLEEYGLDDAEITMDTMFHDDLELESVDLVALSGQLREHYGDRVNFATFIAERDLDEIIALTVGELVWYIVASLRARP